jgi:hypothetical protein
MFCSTCGKTNSEDLNYCRNCGNKLSAATLVESARAGRAAIQPASEKHDPDQLTGIGIRDVIIGDGFFMVAVILSFVASGVSSLLWLFLLIPAFFFFGKGISNVLFARAIRHRQKIDAPARGHSAVQLPPTPASAFGTFAKAVSRDLEPVPSVTERTTRDL